jgi:hypothetical protein
MGEQEQVPADPPPLHTAKINDSEFLMTSGYGQPLALFSYVFAWLYLFRRVDFLNRISRMNNQ